MQTIPQLLLERANDSADRVFCTFRGRDLRYAELLIGVQQMAGALAHAGVGPGSRVGLMLPSSLEHIEMFLALSWLGATAVPFSVHLKSAGLELQVRSSRPTLMLAARAFEPAIRQALAALDGQPVLVWLDDEVAAVGEQSLARLLRVNHPLRHPAKRHLDDLLAISYTSGTTGAPKGVMLSEGYFWVGAKNAGVLSGATRDDTYFMWEPFYHIAAWMTVLLALQHGLRTFMVESFSASKIWQQIAEARATKFHYLGGMVNIMLSRPALEEEKNNTLQIAWGAACPADSWRHFEHRFGVSVREGYGISEGQNFTHLNLDGVVGSIGRPVPELDCWLEDEQGHRVAPGTLGEIVLRPERPGLVMQGYFGEPERTREVLRADGCLLTGDLAVQDEAGNFYFKGRKKDALRRRGENVSAWEVERVLNKAPGVEESAVVGVDSPMGEQDILAVLKLRKGEQGDPLQIARYCADHLAHYQVPRYLQFVDDFPRGPTQRIRKAELSIDLLTAWDSEKAGFKPARSI
jgi:carnitine-CoA ligase